MKIAVISARSGTGKTLVSTSLALSLTSEKARLQFLDCHVERPIAHLLLRPIFKTRQPVTVLTPNLHKEKCVYCGKCGKVCAYNAIVTFAKNVLTFPELCRGCGACSYFCSSKALIEKKREIGYIEKGQVGKIDFVHGCLFPGGIMATNIIAQVKEQQRHNGIIIIDTPAGTSNQVVKAIEGSDFGLLVAVPDTTGNLPLNRITETLEKLNIPCGVLINFSGAGNRDIKEYCAIKEIPVLFTIPADPKIAQYYSKGVTLAEGMPEWQELFRGLFSKIREILSERNSSFKR